MLSQVHKQTVSERHKRLNSKASNMTIGGFLKSLGFDWDGTLGRKMSVCVSVRPQEKVVLLHNWENITSVNVLRSRYLIIHLYLVCIYTYKLEFVTPIA